jgi:hypothetical protein
MGATPVYALPYQGINDAPNGPVLGQALAEAVETLLTGGYATTRDAAAQAITNLAVATLLSSKASLSSVATSQTTASTSYADLATIGPQVALTSVGTRALVFWMLTQVTTVGSAASCPAVSGATTIAPADSFGLAGSDGGSNKMGFAFLTINPGLNTYTLKYRVSGGTGTFVDRRMLVIAP